MSGGNSWEKWAAQRRLHSATLAIYGSGYVFVNLLFFFVFAVILVFMAAMTIVVVMAFVILMAMIVTFVVMAVLDFATIRLAIDLHDHSWAGAFLVQMSGQLFVAGNEPGRLPIFITFVRFGRQNKLFRLTIVRNIDRQFGRVDSDLFSGSTVQNVDLNAAVFFFVNDFGVVLFVPNSTKQPSFTAAMTGATVCRMSSTTSTKPRSFTLHCSTIRRRTRSRLIVSGPPES